MARSRWTIDTDHSLLEFSVKHLMIATVKGRFGQFAGTIVADFPDLTTAEIDVTIEAGSVDTRAADRDTHLRSADFFDVEQHPQLTFRSTRVERAGDDQYRVYGNLTMRGVAREVVLDASFEGTGKDPWGNERAALSATARINRKDWGLNWNAPLEAGGVLVGEQVRIEIQVEAIKQPSEAAA